MAEIPITEMSLPDGLQMLVGSALLKDPKYNQCSEAKASVNHTASPRYTAEEKKWLKKNWKGEFHFLVAHSLKMHSDEDREEGRGIVRAMMEQDTSARATDGMKKEDEQHATPKDKKAALGHSSEADQTIPLLYDETKQQPLTPSSLKIYSLANYASAKGQLTYHVEKSDGSFGISISNGRGIFVSQQLLQSVAKEQRVLPLSPPGVLVIPGLVSEYRALGTTMIDFTLLDRLTNTEFRMQTRVHVVQDLAVDMFIGFSTPLVNQYSIINGKAKLRLDLGVKHVLIT